MNDSDLKTGNHLSPSPKGKDVRGQQMLTHTHTYTHRVRVSQRNGKTTQAPEREGAEREGQQVLVHTHTQNCSQTQSKNSTKLLYREKGNVSLE